MPISSLFERRGICTVGRTEPPGGPQGWHSPDGQAQPGDGAIVRPERIMRFAEEFGQVGEGETQALVHNHFVVVIDEFTAVGSCKVEEENDCEEEPG